MISSRLPQLGRGRLLLAFLVVLACGATAAGAVLLPSDDVRLPNDEVDQYARDANVTREKAAILLQDQGRLAVLDSRLRTVMPSQYAGSWVASDGVTNVICVAAKKTRDLEAVLADAVAAAGMSAGPRFRWGLRSSLVALEREQAQIDRLLAAANRGADERAQVEPDIPKNRLVPHVPRDSTAAQRRAIAKIERESGVALERSIGIPLATFQ